MKTTLLLFLFSLALASPGCAQEPTYQLSSHILDITKGQPAANVKISLSKQDANGAWATLEEKTTDANGRIPDFLKNGEVVFEITDGNHYHVPITLSPFGYSTYRGN